ncbi:MAG TPA: acyl-CoA dehydrogenase [Streptosporangiaceae bacterium]|nr:acyl-CoA dehydrogenase [Streptosporangiaceae bacterium]
MPIAITAEQLAIAESIGLWAKRAGSIAEVRDLETRAGRTSGSDWRTANWRALAELGVFSIALPPALGGIGGCFTDVAVVAEQLAAALVPGPVVPTLLAELVLASAEPGDGGLLRRIAAGEASVAVALHPGSLTATVTPDGGLRVNGSTSLVLGAGDTSHVLLGAQTEELSTWFVLETEAVAAITPRNPVDFSRSIGDIMLTDLKVAPSQVLSGVGLQKIRDLASILAAAEAAAIAAWCSQTAADYARTRQQFGRPIGSFQAIKHLCAGMLCRSEQANAIAWGVARAADHAPAELQLAAGAAGLAVDAAVDNAKDAIQVLGGIGFTWEHDAHLYLRRALALRQLFRGIGKWRGGTAIVALEGHARRQQSAGKVKTKTPSQEKASPGPDEVRKAARLVATALSAVPPERRRKALAEAGYVAPGWPRPYGLGVSPAELVVIDEELARIGVTRPELAIGNWAIPAIAKHGTAEQLTRFAEPTLRGDITWCQLFSEPEAGSDLASLRTRAVQADGGWLLTGQKVWTSLAHQADWAICLARTDPAAPKHKGITYFLVPMRTGGIEIRPLREMTGRQMFNEVFLDDVFVPDDCVVGEPGDGWKIARTTLATERVAMVGGTGLSKEVEELLAAAHEAVPIDPAVILEIGARVAEGLALSAMDDRLAEAATRPSESGSGPAVRKLLGVAHRQAVAETALALYGEQSAAADGDAADAVAEFLLTRCLSIAGGTTQILLNLVAERVLGLPREEAR